MHELVCLCSNPGFGICLESLPRAVCSGQTCCGVFLTEEKKVPALSCPFPPLPCWAAQQAGNLYHMGGGSHSGSDFFALAWDPRNNVVLGRGGLGPGETQL